VNVVTINLLGDVCKNYSLRK